MPAPYIICGGINWPFDIEFSFQSRLQFFYSFLGFFGRCLRYENTHVSVYRTYAHEFTQLFIVSFNQRLLSKIFEKLQLYDCHRSIISVDGDIRSPLTYFIDKLFRFGPPKFLSVCNNRVANIYLTLSL